MTLKRPIEFHQLCAIARTILQTDPAVDDSEWKDRTKAQLSRQGYDYPDPAMLNRALVQIESATMRTLGPRPVSLPPEPSVPQKIQQDDPPWRGSTVPHGWRLLSVLMARLKRNAASAPLSAELPNGCARETLAISESAALDEFWAEAGRPDAEARLLVLRAFAEIAIAREDGWNTEAIRAASSNHGLSADRCFACYSADRSLQWHHVIQIQYGGSNALRNRVSLCSVCHSAVHPWLPEVQRSRGRDWSSVPEIAALIRRKGGAS